MLRLRGIGDVQWIGNLAQPRACSDLQPGRAGLLQELAASEPIELLVEVLPDDEGRWLDITFVHAEQLVMEDEVVGVAALFEPGTSMGQGEASVSETVRPEF